MDHPDLDKTAPHIMLSVRQLIALTEAVNVARDEDMLDERVDPALIEELDGVFDTLTDTLDRDIPGWEELAIRGARAGVSATIERHRHD
jgi:hypothetical protein